MGYIREPKNVDLVVGPSVFTETIRQTITQAIAQYKKTGKKPDSLKSNTHGPVKTVTQASRAQTTIVQPERLSKRKAKI